MAYGFTMAVTYDVVLEAKRSLRREYLRCLNYFMGLSLNGTEVDNGWRMSGAIVCMLSFSKPREATIVST